MEDVNQGLDDLNRDNEDLKRKMETASRPRIEFDQTDEQKLDRLREEADQVLEEIAMKIKSGGAPADQKVIKDDAFLDDLVKETDLLQAKEQERNNIA